MEGGTFAVLPLTFLNFLYYHFNLVIGACPCATVPLYDAAGVSFVHRFDEYGAAVGECYCEDAFCFHICFNHA